MDYQPPTNKEGADEGVVAFETPTNLPPLESPLFLVHQAARPDALRRLYELEAQPRLRFVYQGTAQDDAKLAGPLLIDANQPAAEPHFLRGVREGWAMALTGPELTLGDADAHFKTLLWATTPQGRTLFNFALTSALGGLGGSLDTTQLNRLLGPLTCLVGTTDGEPWQFRRNQPGRAMGEADLLTLTPENLQYMACQRRHRLARALAKHYRLTESTVSAWFEQCRRLGADSEAALAEGARILAQGGHQQPLAEDQEKRLLAQCADWPSVLAALAKVSLMEETIIA